MYIHGFFDLGRNHKFQEMVKLSARAVVLHASIDKMPAMISFGFVFRRTAAPHSTNDG